MAKVVKVIKKLWRFNMTFWLWFNMLHIPFVMVWPDLSIEEEHKGIWFSFWINEFVWLANIVVQCVQKEEKRGVILSDQYDIAVNYIRSTLILDLLASLPQLISGINPYFVIFKFIRFHKRKLLYYPCEEIVSLFCAYREFQFIHVIIYSCSSMCYIVLLMHYAAIFWIWIGSETF